VSRTAVYRLFDAGGTLIYVGSTADLDQRMSQHRSARRWWPQVDPARTTVVWFATRAEAEAAEVSAIRAERPVHNIRSTGRNRYAQPARFDWLSLNAAAEVLEVTVRTIQRSLADDERRTREWGTEGQGWRHKPLAERTIYQLRRSVVFSKAGRQDDV
jgi:predicted GIY-YIG superfamily endonuclease